MRDKGTPRVDKKEVANLLLTQYTVLRDEYLVRTKNLYTIFNILLVTSGGISWLLLYGKITEQVVVLLPLFVVSSVGILLMEHSIISHNLKIARDVMNKLIELSGDKTLINIERSLIQRNTDYPLGLILIGLGSCFFISLYLMSAITAARWLLENWGIPIVYSTLFYLFLGVVSLMMTYYVLFESPKQS